MIDVGVDIGAYSIKIATFPIKDSQYSLQREREVVRDEESKEDFFKWLKKILKDYVSDHRIGSARFHFTVAPDDRDISVAIFDAPSQIEKKMKKTVPIKMIEQVRIKGGEFNQKDFSARFSVIDKFGDNSTLFTSAFRKAIIKKLKGIKGLTWDIGTIETNIVSIGRLMTQKDAIVVDFGESKIRILAFKDNKPTVCQDLSVGGEDFVKAIFDTKVRNFENEEDARKLMHDKAAVVGDDDNLKAMLIDEEAIVISEVIQPLAEIVSRDLRMTISEICDKHDFDPSIIYYVGGLAHIDHFIGYIQSRCDKGIVWRPLLVTGEDTRSISELGERTELYDFYTASGIALAMPLKYMERLDFNKTINTVDMGTPLQFVLILIVAATIGLNGSLIAVNARYDSEITKIENAQSLSANKLESERSQNERLTREISSIQEQIAQTQRLIEDKDTGGSFMGYSASIIDFFDNQKKLSQVMHELQEVTPDGITIIKTICDGSRVLINGYGNNYSQTMLLMMALEENHDHPVLREMVSTDDLKTDVGGNKDGSQKDKEQFFTIELLPE